MGNELRLGAHEMIAMTATKIDVGNHRARFGRLAKLIAIAVLRSLCCAAVIRLAPTRLRNVVLNTSKAGPRSVESLTERAILRDYKFAWVNLEQAMESNSHRVL